MENPPKVGILENVPVGRKRWMVGLTDNLRITKTGQFMPFWMKFQIVLMGAARLTKLNPQCVEVRKWIQLIQEKIITSVAEKSFSALTTQLLKNSFR